MGRQSHIKSWSRVEDVYTVWERLGNTDRPRTTEDLQVVYKIIDTYPWAQDYQFPAKRRNNFHGHLKKMLEEPATYYPFVDEVKIARALDFRPEEWETLTAREYDEVITRLVRMHDPFMLEFTVAGPPGARISTSLLPERARRWLEDFTKKQRVDIRTAVNRRREAGVKRQRRKRAS